MKKRICALFLGYLAWSFIGSLFSKKNSSELKEQAKECKMWWKCNHKIYVDNFIETQKELLNTLKTKLFSSDSKKFLEEKKEEVNSVIEEYKSKWEKLFAELKLKWEKYLKEIKENIEEKKDDFKDEVSLMEDKK